MPWYAMPYPMLIASYGIACHYHFSALANVLRAIHTHIENWIVENPYQVTAQSYILSCLLVKFIELCRRNGHLDRSRIYFWWFFFRLPPPWPRNTNAAVFVYIILLCSISSWMNTIYPSWLIPPTHRYLSSLVFRLGLAKLNRSTLPPCTPNKYISMYFSSYRA